MKADDFIDLMDRADGLYRKMKDVMSDFTLREFLEHSVDFESYTGSRSNPWIEQELIPKYYVCVLVKLLEDVSNRMESEKNSNPIRTKPYLQLVKG